MKKQIRQCVSILGMLCLVLLLNGCASVGTADTADPYAYNPKTGYPAVGGPIWRAY